MTYLHYAAYYKKLEACKILLKRGANPTLRTFSRYGFRRIEYDDDDDDDDDVFGDDDGNAAPKQPKQKKKKNNDGDGKTAMALFPDIQKYVDTWFNKVWKMGQAMQEEKAKVWCNVKIQFAK